MQPVKASDFRWSADQSGQWLCIRTPNATAFLESLNPDKQYDVTIKEHREKRSLDANAYCWTLLDKLAAVLKIPKTELYKSYIREIGGNSETVCVLSKAVEALKRGWTKNGIGWQTEEGPSKIPGCVNVTLYYGSSEYNTAQMSRLIDLIVQDCKAQGVETLTPFQLDALKERWGKGG
jgi:hypothetical protein